jgi:hypothetical protein
MGLFPERETIPKAEERPEEISPLTIERKEVVTPIPTQFTKQVKSDGGQPLIGSLATQKVSIQIPSDQRQLTTLSKGSISDSITWFAAFWIRMIKKATHFGWRIIFGKGG